MKKAIIHKRECQKQADEKNFFEVFILLINHQSITVMPQ